MGIKLYFTESFTKQNTLDVTFDEPIYIQIQNPIPQKIVFTRERIQNKEIVYISKAGKMTVQPKNQDKYDYVCVNIPQKLFAKNCVISKLKKSLICPENNDEPLIIKFI